MKTNKTVLSIGFILLVYMLFSSSCRLMKPCDCPNVRTSYYNER